MKVMDLKCFDLFDFDSKIQILDVGASAIAEVPVYKKLMDMGLAHLNAFEGDERQIEAIKTAYSPNVSIFNSFLYDGTEQKVRLAAPASGMSSLLQPDQLALNFFNGFPVFGQIHAIEDVSTTRLDDVPGLPQIDFVKMDIQGAELTVLKNATEKLKDCVALQLEVSFVCLYENQPGFGEIDVWMRSQGFIPHRFLEVKRWSIAPTVFQGNFRIPGNQLLEADIVYIKNPLDPSKLTTEQLKKLAVISHYCMKSFDLCIHALIELERRNVLPPQGHKLYMENLSSFT